MWRSACQSAWMAIALCAIVFLLVDLSFYGCMHEDIFCFKLFSENVLLPTYQSTTYNSNTRFSRATFMNRLLLIVSTVTVA